MSSDELLFPFSVNVKFVSDLVAQNRPEWCNENFGFHGIKWIKRLTPEGGLQYRFSWEADAIIFALKWAT